MAMNIGTSTSTEPELLTDINTTPLIDVMLVLLIMLIITIPLQTHAVKLDLPNGPPSVTIPDVVTVDIDADGTVLWNKELVPDLIELETKLRAIAAATVQPELHLRPHALVKYKYVATVLAASQRLGVTKLGIIESEPKL